MNPYRRLIESAREIDGLSHELAGLSTAFLTYAGRAGASRSRAYSQWSGIVSKAIGLNYAAADMNSTFGWLGLEAELVRADADAMYSDYRAAGPDEIDEYQPGALHSWFGDRVHGRHARIYSMLAGPPLGQRVLPDFVGLPDGDTAADRSRWYVLPGEDGEDGVIQPPTPEAFDEMLESLAGPAGAGATPHMAVSTVERLALCRLAKSISRNPHVSGLSQRLGPWSKRDNAALIAWMHDMARRCEAASHVLLQAAAEGDLRHGRTSAFGAESAALAGLIDDRCELVTWDRTPIPAISIGDSRYIGREADALHDIKNALSSRTPHLGSEGPDGIHSAVSLLRSLRKWTG